MDDTTDPALRVNIKPPSQVPAKTPDPETSEENEDLDIQYGKLVNLQLEQDLTERKKYAGRIFWLIVGWIVAIFAVVGLQGFSYFGFSISDNVLITLIGGTTINVLGIFIVVANYLFPKTNASPRASASNGGKQQD